MPTIPADEIERAEEAQAAIHEGIERAHELLCEARLMLRGQERQPEADPFVRRASLI
jgi:hypothetical protein